MKRAVKLGALALLASAGSLLAVCYLYEMQACQQIQTKSIDCGDDGYGGKQKVEVTFVYTAACTVQANRQTVVSESGWSTLEASVPRPCSTGTGKWPICTVPATHTTGVTGAPVVPAGTTTCNTQIPQVLANNTCAHGD